VRTAANSRDPRQNRPMTAFVALVGVLVGWAVSSAYSFWAIRRAELERAVVAGTIVGDELDALRAALPGDARLKQGTGYSHGAASRAWCEYRESLVLHIAEPLWAELAALARQLELLPPASLEASSAGDAPTSTTLRDLLPTIDAARSGLESRTAELRAAHQAFILTPLIRYLSSRPWRRRP
jgi:hypothetical protein